MTNSGSSWAAALVYVVGVLAGTACSRDSTTGPTFGPPAALLIEGGQDQSAVVGTELAVALTAKVVDANGVPVRGQAVNFRIVSGGGSVFAGVAITSDSGIARERWTLGTSVADSQRVEARAVDASGNALVFGVFRATARPDVPASVAKVAGDTQTVVVGTPAADSLTVRVADRFGNPVPQTWVRWAIVSGGGTLSSDSSETNALGLARTRWTVGQQVAVAHRVTATVGSLAAETFQATVRAASAVGVTVVTPAAGATSGAPFASAPRVRLVDAFGNTAGGSSTTITLSVSFGGTLLGTTSVMPTAGEGVFTGAGLSGVIGEYTLTYSATALTAATQAISLAAGAPTEMVVTTQPSGAVSGAAFGTQPVVELRDNAGNRTTSTATVTASIASGGGQLQGTTSIAADSGVARFTNLRIDRAQAQTLRFTVTSLALTVLAQPVTVAPGAPTQLAMVTAAARASSGAAFTTQPVIELRDAAGNRTTSTASVTMAVSAGGTVVGTASAAAVAGRVTFTDVGVSGLAGNYTLTFIASGLISVTQTIALAAAVQSVSVGIWHTMILKTDGEIWAAGEPYSLSKPVQMIGAVQNVSAGSVHTMIVKTDGSLWATGDNTSGQLGGTRLDSRIFFQVMSGVQAVSAGGQHTMILKTDGTLWATGGNSWGELGDGTTTNRSTPVQVMSGVQAVSAGSSHTMILKTDGTLWATGGNTVGELGDGTATNRSTPVQVMSGVQAVSAGSSHTMILKTDGTLWATGWNYYGELGDGTTTTRSTPVQVMSGVQAVTAGGWKTMILKTDGMLWATGRNQFGQLGDGTTTDRSTPVPVMSGVQAVSAGSASDHTMILKTDGTLWATGRNQFGQLGDGTRTDRSTPVQVLP